MVPAFLRKGATKCRIMNTEKSNSTKIKFLEEKKVEKKGEETGTTLSLHVTY